MTGATMAEMFIDRDLLLLLDLILGCPPTRDNENFTWGANVQRLKTTLSEFISPHVYTLSLI